MQTHHHRGWLRKKFLIPLALVLLVVGALFALEPFALKQANKLGASVNPEFRGHIEDLDLSLLRGAVVLEGVTATLKKNNREFMQVDEVLVDLAWRELFKGNILFDVAVHSFDVKVAKDIQQAMARLPKSEKKEAKRAFKIAHINIYDSKIRMIDLPGIGKDKYLEVKNIHGSVRDLTQQKDTKLANYNISATLTGKEKINLSGNLDMAADPVRWDLNAKMLKFELNSMNSALRKRFPLNYKDGTLDLYSEAKSENGRIYGYVKPFLNDVEYMGNNNEFKGAGHFLIEVVGTFSNWLFERDKPDTVATRVPFIYENGTFAVESGEAIQEAIEHGLTEANKVERGIENKYRLNARNPAEVQAQEDNLQEAKKKKAEKAKEESEKKTKKDD